MRKQTIVSKDPNKSGTYPSLTRAILRAFGPGYMILSLAGMVSEFVFRYVQLLSKLSLNFFILIKLINLVTFKKGRSTTLPWTIDKLF